MTKFRAISVGFVFLVLNSGWIWAFPEANLTYLTSVLLHIGLGFALTAMLWSIRKDALVTLRTNGRLALVSLSVTAFLGLTLCIVGATRPNQSIVIAHGAFGFVGALLIILWAWKRYGSRCCRYG